MWPLRFELTTGERHAHTRARVANQFVDRVVGSGVMPPRTSRGRRQNQDEMQGPTQGRFVKESSTPRVRSGAGNEQLARTAQEIGRP
ncbi:uncharacterized protein E5676_scaffold19523G00180 [Cucumis melo var. makuwa]|uniref:Uncharacterized protein n=1 Tax=Cucumis melo var. makuwa TaxID=1194695 RepID=A0A5D3DFV9_CUCMM|nr:uncharacterized protein E6C27_scaffold409G00190 [Cucumis melo var. makuwa]TYK22482.1 uncharacterized protein E5676_scaffold19523G00180 [Cucumis melo var. makuwa]